MRENPPYGMNRGGGGNEVDGLMTFCHDARKGRNIGSHWPNHVRASAPLDRMFNQAISEQGLPMRLSTDHDPLFRFHRWQANLRILDVETGQTVPQVPWSHRFIERRIGTLRREYLDRLFF